MPFYEYECSSCKYYTEVMQKISDAPMTKCPSCGEETLQRLISAPVFRLKGGGWYETDFKSDKETKRNLVDGGDGKETSGSDDSKAPVRASKALKKVVGKKAAKKAVRKAGKKVVAKPAKTAAKKTAIKSAAKKSVKKSVKKAAKKPAKKLTRKQPAKPARKK